jgi:hypothetical protein
VRKTARHSEKRSGLIADWKICFIQAVYEREAERLIKNDLYLELEAPVENFSPNLKLLTIF